jgi:hypothetical protein
VTQPLSPPPCCADLEDPPCAQHRQHARVVGRQGIKLRQGRGHAVVGESGRAKPVQGSEEQR